MTDSMEYSPNRKRRRAKQLRAQERRWAAKAGPITVRKIETPEELQVDEGREAPSPK